MGIGAIAGFRARNGRAARGGRRDHGGRGSTSRLGDRDAFRSGAARLPASTRLTDGDAGRGDRGPLRRRLRRPAGQCSGARCRASAARVSRPASSIPPGLVAAALRAVRRCAFRRACEACSPASSPTATHVHAFRDQLGYGLLFYRSRLGGLFAATEAKQVVAGAGIPKEPDLEVVERIVFNDLDDEMPCALARRSPAAQGARSLTTTTNSVQLERYWKPESLLETADLSGIEMQERFDELLGQAVSRCLTGTRSDLAQRRHRLARRRRVRRAQASRAERPAASGL